MIITNRVNGLELVYWKKLTWLQIKGAEGGDTGLKELYEREAKQLMKSLGKHSFVDPFKVWKDPKGKMWILDGHHRQAILEEVLKQNGTVPDLLPAVFIDCRDRKEAGELVLTFTAIYAKPTGQGVTRHMEEFGLELSDIDDLSLPGINFDDFKSEFFDETGLLGGAPSGIDQNKLKTEFEIVVECRDEEEQESIYNKLKGDGYTCRILTL